MISVQIDRTRQRKRRKSALKPVKVDSEKRVIPEGSATKPRWWRVTVGKRYTGTKKTRRFFATERDAKEYIADIEEARIEKGRAAFHLPQRVQVEAAALVAKLEPFDASLTDAVTFFLRHRAKGLRRTLTQLIPDYLRTKANPKYRRAQEISLKLFAKEFGCKPVDSIFLPAIERWFTSKKWNPQNWRNYARDLSMFFNWAQLHDYVGENPMKKLPRPKVPRKAPEIFTVDEAETLLQAASEKKKLELLGMYTIGLFSGVRIEEIVRMRWEMVHWKEGEIRLPAEITKTGQPRNIEITDSLRAWIEKDAPAAGPVVPPTNLRLRREALFVHAGIPRRRNALRHSFASYHAAKHRDPSLLQHLLGQQTPSVLYRHYISATTRTDADAFFTLAPDSKRAARGAVRKIKRPRSRSSRQRLRTRSRVPALVPDRGGTRRLK